MLVHQHGYSAHQHLFGRQPRLPTDVLDRDLDVGALSAAMAEAGAEYAAAVRYQARVAWLQLSDYQAMRKAVDQRPRAVKEFQPGDSVCYWRTWRGGGKKKSGRPGRPRWYGHALVVGSERTGGNKWVAHGHVMLKVAPQHLRPASLHEIHGDQLDWELLDEQTQLRRLQQGKYRGYVDLVGETCGTGGCWAITHARRLRQTFYGRTMIEDSATSLEMFLKGRSAVYVPPYANKKPEEQLMSAVPKVKR